MTWIPTHEPKTWDNVRIDYSIHADNRNLIT